MNELSREQVEQMVLEIIKWTGFHSQPIARYLEAMSATDAALREHLDDCRENSKLCEGHLWTALNEKDAELKQLRHRVSELEKQLDGPTVDYWQKMYVDMQMEANKRFQDWSRLQQNFDTLTARLREVEKERHTHYQTVLACDKGMTTLRQQLAEVTQELDAYRSGGVTEELLRQHDGFLKLGTGYTIVRTEDWNERLHYAHEIEERDTQLAKAKQDLQDALLCKNWEEIYQWHVARHQQLAALQAVSSAQGERIKYLESAPQRAMDEWLDIEIQKEKAKQAQP